jgi:hypothetical protein
MKKLLLLLTLLPLISNAQISVEKSVESVDIGRVGNAVYCTKTDDMYSFLYKNMEYQNISDMKSFYFLDIDNAFENLYQIIITEMETPPEECERVIKIPEGRLILQYSSCTKGIINRMVMINVYNDGETSGYTTWMNRKKIDKLFGKR